MRPIFLGISASFFFAVSFILNRAMSLSGGSWIWSASLRYVFMVPFLLLIVISRKNLCPLLQEMRNYSGKWLLWSTIGFGLFYAPLCFASAYGPGWLIAGTWQITIISGSLLAPFFYETVQSPNGVIKIKGTIPLKGLSMSFIILLGIPPSRGQIAQSLIVAISSGVVATILFFRATDMVKDNIQKLASVEATQSLEVLFTLLGELVMFPSPAPAFLSWIGMFLVIIGCIVMFHIRKRQSRLQYLTHQKYYESIFKA